MSEEGFKFSASHDFQYWLVNQIDLSEAIRVLDIGYGDRHFEAVLKKKKFSITYVGIEEGDSKNIEGVFDYVFMLDVIEHLPFEERKNYFELIRKHLSKNGLFVLSTANINNLYQISLFWDEPTHIRPYTQRSFIALGKIFGFKVKYFKGFHFFKNPLKIFFNKLLLLDNYNKLFCFYEKDNEAKK